MSTECADGGLSDQIGLRLKTHSRRSPPIKRLWPLSSSTIHILPRTVPSSSDPSSRSFSVRRRDTYSPHPSSLRHDDSLLLRFRLSDSVTLVTLSLRPTENLIHSQAVVKYHSEPDLVTGETTITTLPLARESVRAYSGWVVDLPTSDDPRSSDWWAEEASLLVRPEHVVETDPRVLGWARVLIHETEGMEDEEDEVKLVWEGVFELEGVVWEVKTVESYRRGRAEGDMDAEHFWGEHRTGGLVAWRIGADQDMTENSEEMGNGCSHDALSFNVDPSHKVYRVAKEQALLASPYTNSSPVETAFGLPSFRQPFSPTLPSYPPRPESLNRRQGGNDISGNVTSNFISSIGSTAGCPTSQKVVFLGVAADCTYVQRQSSSQNATRTQILSNINSASGLYQRSFNVSLGVVELEVMNAVCPTTASSTEPWNVGCPEGGPSGLDLNARLSVFSQWRGNKGGSDGAGLWHLMTDCSTGSEIGVAWLGQLCQVDETMVSGGQYSSGTGVTSSTTSEWQVVAHEIGHNFGAIHDCSSGCSVSGSCCPFSATSCNANSNFIMSATLVHNTSSFSSCSIGNICTTLSSSDNATCLEDPGQRTVISLQQCGNGIVEPGEDCDPGNNITSPCCNRSTCKFTAGAVCDPFSSTCCTTSCQFAPTTTICRPAINSQCDFAEMCTSNSSTCPADKTVADGTSCGASGQGLYCAAGLCTSRDQQCKEQGSAMNITAACSSTATGNSCSLTCADPISGSDCIILQGSFVDGTSCGLGGRCSKGQCASGSLGETIISWYKQNLQIAIPVSIIAGIMVLLLIGCLINCCRRRRKVYPQKRAAPSARFRPSGPPIGAAVTRPVWNRGVSNLRSQEPGHFRGNASPSSPQPIWIPSRLPTGRVPRRQSTHPTTAGVTGEGRRGSQYRSGRSRSEWIEPAT